MNMKVQCADNGLNLFGKSRLDFFYSALKGFHALIDAMETLKTALQI